LYRKVSNFDPCDLLRGESVEKAIEERNDKISEENMRKADEIRKRYVDTSQKSHLSSRKEEPRKTNFHDAPLSSQKPTKKIYINRQPANQETTEAPQRQEVDDEGASKKSIGSKEKKLIVSNQLELPNQ